jgi:hypothetical protein
MCSKTAESGLEAGIKNVPAGGSSSLTPLTINFWGYFWGYIKKEKLLNYLITDS